MEGKPDRSFPARLRHRRIALGKKLGEGAAAIGVHANTLYKWEAGLRVPQPWHYKAIAEYLGEDLDSLMEELENAA